MGMYSYVQSHDLETTKADLLVSFLRDKTIPAHIPERFRDTYKGEQNVIAECMAEAILEWDNSKDDFHLLESLADSFDELKIIEYWYEGFCCYLRELAQFIEGTIRLRYETNEEFAKIVFENCDVRISIGEINFTEEIPIDLFSIPPLPEHIKLLRKL